MTQYRYSVLTYFLWVSVISLVSSETFQANNHWGGGFQVHVSLTAPQDFTEWQILLTFSVDITSVDEWVGVLTKISDRQFSIRSNTFNGKLTAGTELSFSFIGHGAGDIAPSVDAIFVGSDGHTLPTLPSTPSTTIQPAKFAAGEELFKNGGFEDDSAWDCFGNCTVVTDAHSGKHAWQVINRAHDFDGPSQTVPIQPGYAYQASGYIRLLNDVQGKTGQSVQLEVDYTFADKTHDYIRIVSQDGVTKADGWVKISGAFTVPTKKPLSAARVYYQGPDPSVNFLTDEASLILLGSGDPAGTKEISQRSIDKLRKSDINFDVTLGAGVNKDDVKIHVVQTKKSFPFGTAVSATEYNSASTTYDKYRQFIHDHFNWATPENSLKWQSVEREQGRYSYNASLTMINRLRAHGIKVRGHNLVWSVQDWIPNWVQQLSGDALKDAVKTHIIRTMNVTKGLVECWDVNNENLHGQWFQDKLKDPAYNLEIFRIAHAADPAQQLFLNDYNVVSESYSTNAYRDQGKQFKAANVGLSGMGAQCHFSQDNDPQYFTIHQRLDTLAEVGVPLWVTEMDVIADNENKRADYLEHGLRALYSHPAVEGIILWGFWDQRHWKGTQAALAKGPNLELTAAGRRLLDLLEDEWMTDETKSLSTVGTKFTVRGFHGDYEVHVLYQGKELTPLKQTFTLEKTPKAVAINVKV